MQNRKELAEAGRRKLEEFRKAKAQGKAVTTTPPSKPIKDAAAQPPPSSNTATAPLANGGGNSYPPASTPAADAGAPTLAPRPPADPASQHPHHPTPNGGPAVTAPLPAARPWEHQPPAPPPAPIAPPPSASASSSPSAPITTFVVLADAPIPFGAPAPAPTSQVSRTSSSGFAWATTNATVTAPPGGAAAWNGGSSQAQAQPRSSDPASGWPWDPRPGGGAQSQPGLSNTYANAHGPAAAGDATAASNGGGSFFDSWGKDQYGSTASQPIAPASSSSSVAGAGALFGGAPDAAGRSGSSSTAPPAAPLPYPPSALGGSPELHGPYGQGAGHDASSTNTDLFSSLGSSASRGAAAESGVPSGAAPSQPNNGRPEPHGQPASSPVDSTATAAPGTSLGVTAPAPEASTPSPGQWPLPGTYGWQPAQPPAAAGPPAVVEAAEVTRPSWLSYSAAAAAAPMAPTAPQEQSGAAAAVAADGPGWLPAPGPVPTSSPAREAAQDTSPVPGAGSGGLTAGGADAAGADTATASTSLAAASGNAVMCYGHLSDSYLGGGGGGDDALAGPAGAKVACAPAAPAAPAVTASAASPPPAAAAAAAPLVVAQQPLPWDQGAAAAVLPSGGASPDLPVSVPISPGVSPGADVAGSYGVPAPAPAPAPSRFAWLFGTPPPARQPAPQELPASSAMPWTGQHGPPPPPPLDSVSAPPSSAEYGSAPFASRPPGPDTASASDAVGAWTATSAAQESATRNPLPPPPPQPQSNPDPSTTQMAGQQQQHLGPSSPIAGGQRAGYVDSVGPGAAGGAQWQSGRSGTAGPYRHQYDYAADVGPSGGSVPSLLGVSDSLGYLSTAAPAAAPPAAAGSLWGAAAAAPPEQGPGLGAVAPPAAGGGPYGSAAADVAASSGAPVYGIGRGALYGGIGRDALYGSNGEAAAGPYGRDAGGPVLPSFLRGVEQAGPAASQELFNRSGPASSAPSALPTRLAPWPPPSPSGDALAGALGGGSLGGLSRDAALTAPSSSSAAAPGAVQPLPSFTTSFPPLAPASDAPASLQPLPHTAAAPWPLAAHASPPPAASALHPASATTSAPHFSAAATYLSAYTSAGGAGALSHGSHAPPAAAAATTTTTSSFLESYLDNLLATMSAPKDGADDAGARPGSATGVHPSRSGGAGQSAVGTPRHSSLGDTQGDAVGAHAAGEGLEDVSGGGLGGDRVPGTSDVPAGAGLGVLDGAGGSGRGVGTGLAHVDSSAQLRSHHSRRVSSDSVGVLSVYSHATGLTPGGGPGAHPGGQGSGISRAQFTALQQHIDELTEEKLTLSRGLQQQTRINEQLAEENEELMRQYNARGAAMEELQRKMKQYEQELEAQALSLEGCSEERQAARSSYAEASSRAQGLAAEVVGLEAQLLQLKSSVLKAQRVAEEAQQRAKKLEKQVETLSREAQDRAQELQQTQLKGRNLVVKLKQTETKLQAAEEKLAQQAALMATVGPHGLANGHPPPPPPPPPKPTSEQEVQCELEAELAAAAAANGGQAGGAGHEDAAMAPAEGAAQDPSAAGDAASVSSGAGGVAAAGVGPGSQQLALAQQPSGPHSDALDASDHPARAAAVDWEAARPQRDAPSAVVAERALASLDSRALRGGGGVFPEGLDMVALQLARWLPAGPVSGGDPVAVMVEEELRLMQSIHELLGSFEQAQEASAEQIAELRAHVESLTHENEELRQKLELQTQRLELQMQGLQGGQPLSLHQTPALASAGVEGGSAAAAVTPVSGHCSYQPAQPFLPAPPEAESAVVTPTRSTRGNPGTALDGPGLAGGTGAVAQPAKQTWMGYLFRPRQKKRTRSALL